MSQPPVIDTSVAHEARMYNYWLGGKDNYPADRALAEAVIAQIPTIGAMARANRAFLGRSVRYQVQQGVRQFLDIGTGIPTEGNVHEVAQGIAPESRVVYADKDPIVLAHARALMSSTPEGRTAYIQADLNDPESILKDPAVAEVLDLGQPVGIMLIAILMYVQEADPADVVRTLLDAVPPGSYLTITHATADFDPVAVNTAIEAGRRAGITFTARTHAEVAALFGGLELVEPGVVPVLSWKPELGATDGEATPLRAGQPDVDPKSAYYYCGVGRKP
jgi:hypothetical protein